MNKMIFENMDDIKMGKLNKGWRENEAKYITLSITQECNLRCTYCYMNKSNDHKMSIETAMKVVDYILINQEDFNTPAVVWEFIGGEPLLEIDLIDQISDYIKLRLYELNHPWFSNYIFFIATNGLLYNTEKVQKYIKKNHQHVSVGMTIDGNKIKHDMSRVKLNGTGSYDDVVKNVPLWLSQFPNSMTKATFAHMDLPYLCDSIKSLWDIGIKTIAANVVFEDVWQAGDATIFEDQLKKLADYVIDNELWNDYSVRFFEPTNGFAIKPSDQNKSFCGAGKMLAVDDQGTFFPCIRFLDFCQNSGKSRDIGNYSAGLNQEKIRPFLVRNYKNQSSKECRECDIASGCANCVANDFDYSSCGSIFYRATFICDMHKANTRANKYFWEKYATKTKRISEREKYWLNLLKDKEWVTNSAKFLYFITSDFVDPHCCYEPIGHSVMDSSVFEQGIIFCRENNLFPIFIGQSEETRSYLQNHAGYIIDSKPSEYKLADVFTEVTDDFLNENQSNMAILHLSHKNIGSLYNYFSKLSKKYNRINLVLHNIESFNKELILLYTQELEKIKETIIHSYKSGRLTEFNVLTDVIFNQNLIDCKAGSASFALAPNGNIYPCPAFYFDNTQNGVICSVEDSNFEKKLLDYFDNKLPVCSNCNALHCKACRFSNIKTTGEYNIPSEKQCRISFVEAEIASSMSRIFEETKQMVE